MQSFTKYTGAPLRALPGIWRSGGAWRLAILIVVISNVASGQINIAGPWNFTGHSTSFGLNFSASGTITQTGTSITSNIFFVGNPCANSTVLSGTISGSSLDADLNENGQHVRYQGTVSADGNSASGTYTSPAFGCTNLDQGTWTGARTPPVITPPVTVPTITSITSAADYSSGITVEGYTAIFGNLLSSGINSASQPYPSSLGGTTISICTAPAVTSACSQASIIYTSPTQVNVLVNKLPTGYPPTNSTPNLYFFAAYGGSAGPPLAVAYDQPALDMFSEGYDCYTDANPFQIFLDVLKNCGLSPVPITKNQVRRSIITDVNGSLVWSGNPARINGYYTIWATGLGLKPGLQALSFQVSTTPQYSPSRSTITIPIKALYTGETPQYPGLYQINFQLPSGVAHPGGLVQKCGLTIEVSLISGSKSAWLPIILSAQDNSCIQ